MGKVNISNTKKCEEEKEIITQSSKNIYVQYPLRLHNFTFLPLQNDSGTPFISSLFLSLLFQSCSIPRNNNVFVVVIQWAELILKMNWLLCRECYFENYIGFLLLSCFCLIIISEKWHRMITNEFLKWKIFYIYTKTICNRKM